eukprot:366577-Chlamydomonas_euryale.AAC.20
MGGWRLAVGGDRRCLLLGSRDVNTSSWPGWPVQTTATHVAGFLRFPGTGRTGLAFIPWGLHGRAHAVWWDFQDPWAVQTLSFESSYSPRVLSSCA